MVVMGGGAGSAACAGQQHRGGHAGHADRGNPRARCVDLNEFISCIICNGYLIDATTVTECLHTCECSSRCRGTLT